ncbi:MAG TPA: hypothetical protein PK413_13560 [Thermoanaerobaculia bacterium]|nr:hypothetical protein [Thermoanaerobaculia bacterium]
MHSPLLRRARISLAGCLLAALAIPGFAAQAPAAGGKKEAKPSLLPDTLAAKALTDWLVIVNGGDENKIVQFLGSRLSQEFLSRFPMDALKSFHLNILGEYGKLQPESVKASRPEKILVVASGAKGKKAEVTIGVDEAEPHKINVLRVVEAQPEPPPQPATATPAKPPGGGR